MSEFRPPECPEDKTIKLVKLICKNSKDKITSPELTKNIRASSEIALVSHAAIARAKMIASKMGFVEKRKQALLSSTTYKITERGELFLTLLKTREPFSAWYFFANELDRNH